ncbi:ankyrin repeat domain-containing protein 17-like [Schistocerca nitens]|uniref:ankyrin repeat domain-containing protein 17-like n=1 Tax=Schistocerca nitens TaxID=7011 RepID=UPI002117E2ED|nr:ankyrin repeat domain-containing protein 17-like [Schistocerca nitens]XP_049797372.1 ankyrin repeat domain-containing protein 17-like [Schistocerca nitens]
MEAVKDVQETTAMDLSSLLDDGDDATVKLVAGDTRLLAHRAVLVARSPVFAAMFSHDTVEASSGKITIPDVEGPVLRQLLSYLYTLQPPKLPGMAPQLLAAADKYGVTDLKASCEQQVAAGLGVETAVAAAVLAIRHACPGLRQAAVSFVKAHTQQVMATQGWADAVVNHPHDFVEFTRLIAEPSVERSSPAPADSRPTTTTADTHRKPHSQTPAAASPPTAAQHSSTAPPDDDVVSRLRGLTAEQKGRELIDAAKEGAISRLRALLAAGADVRARDSFRRDTALHWAARKGCLQAVVCLLSSGAEVDARNNWQSTPLLLAAQYGHTEVVSRLLEAGADKGARDGDGDTPLYVASKCGHQEIVEMLT